jgi:exodeoxyribonuclease V gamma subunit
MSIQLYVSNSLPKLSAQLCIDLGKNNMGVFDKKHVVTQTEGMNNWLKINIAGHLGIAANCFFSKPNDAVSDIYYLLGGKGKPVLSVDYLKWNIYHLLTDPLFMNKFPFIAGYFKNSDIKQIALATKVADLFDQYQIYRPDIITSWNNTDITAVSDDWQQWLWISIHALVEDKMLDKTNIIQHIVDALKEQQNQLLLKTKLPHLHFFGIAVITPFYLSLFNELSKHISISFYLLNPAPTSYWLEDKSEKEISRFIQKAKKKTDPDEYFSTGNALLNSWGSIVKDSFSLLFEDERNINLYDDSLVDEPTTPITLLKKVQHDIFFNLSSAERNEIKEIDVKDGSIIINSCFTQVREVEVLYNYLVELVDTKNEAFSPRDIVVMVSDIDNYAPYIRAVFDNAPYRFPYTIADESISIGNALFNAIELILNLQLDSLKAEEVLELMESKYIRDRFSIKDISMIRKVVDAANIRFGLDGEHDNDTRLVSWHYGLKRIMYGLCISGEPLLELGNEVLIPLDFIEGGDSDDVVHFCYFMQVLEIIIKQRSTPKSIAQWGAYMQEFVERLVFQAGEKEDEDYHQLINYLEKIILLEDVSNVPIGFEVFKHSFLEILEKETKAKSFASAGITFCSLIPMRSIPFKVVALLGMDFDKFPRKDVKLSFNLLDKQRRKGDRNVKENDKHLFLETLLSAEKYFYISYIGKSVKDGTKIPPSSLVDELVEYIIQGVATKDEKLKDVLINAHPLHGFSQLYFNGSGLVSYLSDEKYKLQGNIPVATKEEIAVDFNEIAVTDLMQFFKDPIKWYFNKAFGIYYREDDLLLPDTEVFSIDKLSSWQINQDLFQLSETEYEQYFEKKSRQGVFPLKNMGTVTYQSMLSEIEPKKELIESVKKRALHTKIEININLGNAGIAGFLTNVYEDKLIAYTDSKIYRKHIVEAFVSYMIALAQGFELEFHFVVLQSKNVFSISKGTISKNEAFERLKVFVDYYKSGFNTPFLFYPGFKMNPYKLFEDEDGSGFEQKIRKIKYDSHDYTFTDPYMLKAYENKFFVEANYDKMKENTMDIFNQLETLMPDSIKK